MIKDAQWFQLRTIPCDESKHLSSLKICLLLFFSHCRPLKYFDTEISATEILVMEYLFYSFVVKHFFSVGKCNSTPEISLFVSSHEKNPIWRHSRVSFATTKKNNGGTAEGNGEEKLFFPLMFTTDIHSFITNGS